MNIPYIRSGDYFIPDLKLPEESRPIGKWGRMYREYLREHHPIQFNNLVLSGNLWTSLPCQKARTTIQRAAPNARCCPHFCVGYSETACGSFWRFARAATSRRLWTFSLR